MNKASGGDEIPAELFQILSDDAVKVLHSICQQIGKAQQWPQGSHNEKLSLECQYLQGTLAAVAGKSCTGVGTTVNNEEKKPFKFIKRRNKSSCSHC